MNRMPTACITTIDRKKWARIVRSGKSYEWLLARYHQPDWCDYPDAIHPLGCWGLMSKPWDRKGCPWCDFNTSLSLERLEEIKRRWKKACAAND